MTTWRHKMSKPRSYNNKCQRPLIQHSSTGPPLVNNSLLIYWYVNVWNWAFLSPPPSTTSHQIPKDNLQVLLPNTPHFQKSGGNPMDFCHLKNRKENHTAHCSNIYVIQGWKSFPNPIPPTSPLSGPHPSIEGAANKCNQQYSTCPPGSQNCNRITPKRDIYHSVILRS